MTQEQKDTIREALEDWVFFASDVMPNDAAGADWLEGLRGRTARMLLSLNSLPVGKPVDASQDVVTTVYAIRDGLGFGTPDNSITCASPYLTLQDAADYLTARDERIREETRRECAEIAENCVNDSIYDGAGFYQVDTVLMKAAIIGKEAGE